MDTLQSVVAYWRDCIKAESALEQSFEVDGHTFGFHEPAKADLFPGDSDPFIFAKTPQPYLLPKGRLQRRLLKAHLKSQDIYFGYPLLMFFDRATKKHHVAPLFSIRLEVQPEDEGLLLRRSETTPLLGSCAFTKLGLAPEQIVALSEDVGEAFEDDSTAKLEVILYLLKKRTNLTLIETLDPEHLKTADTIHPYDGTIIYNSAMLSVGGASSFNVHLLDDLEHLATRRDLKTSSLRYITGPATTTPSDHIPVLPFQFDAYHVQAIQRIMSSDHAVVTGPPGTGKSQFIANLIINLFLQRKRVLFVSHTGEAVRVVNERINQQFTHLMMQTGKKEVRQDLGRRLEELVNRYNDRQPEDTDELSYAAIAQNWRTIVEKSAYVSRSNQLHRQLERVLMRRQANHRQPLQLKSFLDMLQERRLSFQVGRRQSSQEVVADIEAACAEHTTMSRDYIQATYLARMLESGAYGDLVSYVQALQRQRANSTDTTRTSDRHMQAALQSLSIWSCTLKSLGASFPLTANLFDYVIFDEASQIDLPSAAPALYRARRAVIVGDDKQLKHIATLNPKTEAALAEQYDLPSNPWYPALVSYTQASLFQSARQSLREPELELKNHYRSNALIANLFSSVFYGGRLRIYEPEPNLPPGIPVGATWIDVAGTSMRHKSGSVYNPEEAAHIVKLLRTFAPLARQHNLTIGVTTPYGKQQSVIADKAAAVLAPDDLAHIRIMTVHKFQGSEVDILLFSPVLAQKGDGSSDWWYTRSEQILNVAVSRAKQALLIVGDRDAALKSRSKLRDIAVYCSSLATPAGRSAPVRPMNIFERKLLQLLQSITPPSVRIEPQHMVDGRFALDFALFTKDKKIAIELDGRPHDIIGGLPIFVDKRRDAALVEAKWEIVRISVYELLHETGAVKERMRAVLHRSATSKP